jgi:DNA-binding transcriptional regulator YdaS (Cro superfamily)
MDKLIQFLNGLKPPEQIAFAERCGTTIGYLRKAASKKQKLGDGLCINIERETQRQVRCEDLRADIDWAYLRGTRIEKHLPAMPAHGAGEPVQAAAG